MNKPTIARKFTPWLLFLWLAFFSFHAFAAVDNVGVLNNVLDRFETAAATWKAIMIARASWLFWLLVVVSMVWTFGMMGLRKADIGEFFAEFVRFTLFTGFFWWLLVNGPKFAVDITNSLRTIGSQASGLPNDLGPSSIVDVGFDIFFKVIDQSIIWRPMDSLFGMILAAVILVVFALVGTNMLLLLVSGYLFAYAGVFILGFGGSKWTSEMAIGYYKSILNIALQLMTMVLLVGIGRSFVDQYYTSMSAGISLKELGVMTVVAAVLLFLVAKIPPQIGALAGGTTGNLGSNFGVGAAVGAAAMGAAAVATAGAAIAAGAAGAAGGIQALMSAYSKASAAESAGGGTGSMLAAADGGGAAANDAGGGSPLSAAMGDSGGSSSGSSSGSGGAGASGGSGGSADLGGGTSLDGSTSLDGGGNSASNASGADQSSSAGSTEAGEQAAAASDGSKDGATGEAKQGGFRAKAARAGRIAAGTAANLAVGSWDVAKAKGSDLRQGAMDRIAGTTGGKIAAAINTRAAANKAAKFGDDSLSAAADEKDVDAASEVAAFRDRDSKAS